MTVIGVDPGKTGALAVLHDDGTAEVFDAPETPAERAALVIGVKVACKGNVTAAIERNLYAVPRGGHVSANAAGKLGHCQGIWLGIFAALGIPYQEPAPQTWGKVLTGRAPGKTQKDRAKAFACAQWPELVFGPMGGFKDGRGDALCIAQWLSETIGG